MAPEAPSAAPTSQATKARGRRRVWTMRLELESSGQKSSRHTSPKEMSTAPTEMASSREKTASPAASTNTSAEAGSKRRERTMLKA